MEQSTFLGIAGLIAAASAAISPFILLRIKRREKLDDWKRQDQVADRLEAAQQLSIRKTDEVAVLVAAQSESANGQLKSIHAFLNQEKTDRLEGERNDKLAMLVLLKRVGPLENGDKLHVSKIEDRIVELDKILSDRAVQQRLVDAQLAGERKAGG